MTLNNAVYEYIIKVEGKEYCYNTLKEAKKHAKVISYKDGLYTFYNAPNFKLFRKFNTYQNSLINICNKWS